jgi:PAS domain S-box-containing protein
LEKRVNKGAQNAEGRKILYRLLLLAVAVVYVLVFVLDYMLQLHFTFFLLLSFFGFVILTLLYMWFRIQSPDKLIEEEFTEESKPLDKKRNFRELIVKSGLIFEDALFTINTVTGLTIECSEGAVKLFEASGNDQLLGIDLTDLFDPSWPVEERNGIKLGLDKSGRAKVYGIFRTLNKRPFEAELQAMRIVDDGISVIQVRIYPVTRTKPEAEKIPVKGFEWFDDAGFPMAIIGQNYGFMRVNNAFCNLTGYTAEELLRMSSLELIHPEERKAEKNSLSALFRGELVVSKREKRLIRRNNEIAWINTSSSLSKDKDGHPKFIVVTAENVTQRKRIQAMRMQSMLF